MSRRRWLTGVIAGSAAAGMGALTTRDAAARAAAGVVTGAAAVAAAGFAAFTGKRIGLITNQTGRVGDRHLADLLQTASDVQLAAVFSPEHGFRSSAEAGAAVADATFADNIPLYSLYGATRRPTERMLAGIDVLVFDIQDIGARFYTYISTLGLAMQAAARRRIPFVVLDRPNPLGGDDVSGFALDPAWRSFVGLYPVPIVHGMTVGELARMIQGERWLDGLETLDLGVLKCEGLTRAMRWPATLLPWVATSPNIPTFEAALSYPGIGIVGETLVNEGRGTPFPFSQFGAPWVDADRLAVDLSLARLPGVRFEPTRVIPRPVSGAATRPRFAGEPINAVRLHVTDVDGYRPLEIGIHALVALQRQARTAGAALLPDNIGVFRAIAGTSRLHRRLEAGASGAQIIRSWQREVALFRERRTRYLLY